MSDIQGEAERTGTVQREDEKAQRDLINVYNTLWGEQRRWT